MWSIEYVKAKNIISFSDLFYEVKNGVALPIVGQNLDDMGQEANGAGKSALFEIIAMTLAGQAMRKVSIKENIRDGEDEGETEVKLVNKTINSVMLISRVFRRKKSTVTSILYNGQVPNIKTSDSGDLDTAEANAFILEKLGISREDLFNYYLISSQNFVSFLNASDTKKKEIVSRFSNAEMVDKTIDYIQTEFLDDFNKQIIDIEKEIISIEAKQEVYRTQKAELDEAEFEKLKTERIEKLTANITSSKNAISKHEKTIDEKKEKISKIKTDLSPIEIKMATHLDDKKTAEGKGAKKKLKLDEKRSKLINKRKSLMSEKTSNLNDEIEETETDKETVEETIKNINEKIVKIDNKLAGNITCPKCEHEFRLDKDETVEELNRQKKLLTDDLNSQTSILKKIDIVLEDKKKELDVIKLEVEKELEDGQTKVTKLENKVDELRAEYRKHSTLYNDAEFKVKQFKKEIEQIEISIKSVETQISDENKSIEKYKKLKKQEKAKTLDTKKQEIADKLDELDDELIEVTNKLGAKSEESAVYENWRMHFIKFKTRLANNSVKTIESFANFYLNKMGSGLRLQIEGYKTLASGEIREKISSIVFRDGFEKGSYGKFSAGERARIDIAVTAALQTIINSSSQSGGLNMLFLDEVLDAVDTLGLKSILTSLQNLGITIMIVTQNTIDQLGENCILVQKEQSKSKMLIR